MTRGCRVTRGIAMLFVGHHHTQPKAAYDLLVQSDSRVQEIYICTLVQQLSERAAGQAMRDTGVPSHKRHRNVAHLSPSYPTKDRLCTISWSNRKVHMKGTHTLWSSGCPGAGCRSSQAMRDTGVPSAPWPVLGGSPRPLMSAADR